MLSLLSTITGPQDLRSLSIPDLQVVSEEIRHTIIDVLSQTGGHLASNLGIVELTIALHTVFQSPQDKLLFDVSHQTYPHKLLTGRQGSFSKLRQYKGLCGFSHPQESPHDLFFAGHAGTALSLGLGIAKERDLQQQSYHILPIIGDASLTCGLTLEALNNIPKDLKKFLVILNDNNMSISKNVGAITKILSRLLCNPTSNRIYHEIQTFLSKIPNVGSSLAKQGHKWAESLKNLVSPASFFEQFGLSYVGPIDGHDIGKLLSTFEALQEAPGPTLVHVLTTKGKGMESAIHNPTCYHGCKPFDKITGQFHKGGALPTFPQIFGEQMVQQGCKDPHLVAVTPAMTAGSCLEAFQEKFPDRCIDVGIAEGHAVTFCGALASSGSIHVVCSIYATFLQRALDNVFHDVCLQNSPVIFAIDRAGISAPDGATHHGIYDISFLQSMPSLIICQPRNGQLLAELLESSFSWKKPTAIRYPNMTTTAADAVLQSRPLGKAEILRHGSSILLIALGHMNSAAIAVAEILEQQHNLSCCVVDPIFLKPLDADLFLELLSSHTLLFTIEEHAVQGGLGTAINQFLIENNLTPTKAVNIGIGDFFLEHGSYANISQDAGLGVPQILETILSEIPAYSSCTGMP